MKPGKRTPGGLGPKEGDFIPPKAGGDGLWRRVVLVQRGKVMVTEVWHGDPPDKPGPKKKAAKKAPAWTPKPPDPLAIPPVVEKFLLWRFQPTVRPTAKGLTQTRLDRYIRLALVGKNTNYHRCGAWPKVAREGIADVDLMKMVHQEFGCSSQRNPQDKRRVEIRFCRIGNKGKNAAFVVGADDDPDKVELTGRNLLAAVRRAMKISPVTRDEAVAMQAFIASFTFPTPE